VPSSRATFRNICARQPLPISANVVTRKTVTPAGDRREAPQD
jgi:hypothetical protein